MVVAGQQPHQGDDLARIDEPTKPESPDAGQARISADDDDAAAVDGSSAPVKPSSPAEATARPVPAVPIRLLLLVTAANVLLALGLLTIRPPWRIERGEVPAVLPAQVGELQARVGRGEHGIPYALTLTDDELTATARYFLAQSTDVPFSQVRVAVVDGRLEATGVTTGLAVAVPVRVVANVEARNGAPVVSVADVGIGGLALPAFVREQILREANRAVDLSRYDLAVTVDAVTLRSGALDVRGIVR